MLGDLEGLEMRMRLAGLGRYRYCIVRGWLSSWTAGKEGLTAVVAAILQCGMVVARLESVRDGADLVVVCICRVGGCFSLWPLGRKEAGVFIEAGMFLFVDCR